MAATPLYALPYAGLNDPPHGPNQERDLALGVENNIAVPFDARLDAMEAAGGLGGWIDEVNDTANSSTWNGTTEVRVLTSNAVGLVSGVRYAAVCDFALLLGATAAMVGFRLRYKAGGVPTSADQLIVPRGGRFDVSTGVFMCQVKGTFVAPSTGSFNVAMFGCNPSGDTSVCRLYGSSSTAGNGLSTNTISIYRVRG